MIFLFDDKTEPADIFEDIPSEKPSAVPPQLSPSAAASNPARASGVVMEHATFGKKGVLLLLLVLILVGGSVAAFFLWRRSFTETPQPIIQNPQPTPQPEPQPQPQPQPEPQPEPQPQTERDTDSDGLTDTRESQLGTNPGMIDSDSDGLSDREEVDVYATDPLKADTDNDTYKDGDEVKNGYDPKGPGKLLQIPPAP